MSKKSFRDSTASAFFSAESKEAPAQDQQSNQPIEKAKAPAKKPAQKPAKKPEPAEPQPAGAVKAFRAKSKDGKKAIKYIEVPDGYDISAELYEKRNKRVQLLIQPSLYNSFKNIAEIENVSINELINRAMREFLER